VAAPSRARHSACFVQAEAGVFDPIHDYEQVSVYALDDAQRDELLRTHAEYTFDWATRDGGPMGVIIARRGLVEEKR
jgi:hypothetical protein